MKAALIVLKPRQITVTERAFAELPNWFPIIELVGYTEAEIAGGIFQEAMDRHPHDFYLVASDDLIVRWNSIAQVITRLSHETVTTGYCQFTHTDWRVNITDQPLQGDLPVPEAYEFVHYRDVVSGPPVQQTWFTGMSLTGMSAAMWGEEFPFGCYVDDNGHGYASDFHLSKRLQDANVRINVVRDAFNYHWRNVQEHTNDSRDDQLVVGQVEPEIRLR